MTEVSQPSHAAPVAIAPPASSLLSIVHVARRLNVSVSHVYRLIESGDLPCQKVGPRALRIDAGDLADYLAALNGGLS